MSEYSKQMQKFSVGDNCPEFNGLSFVSPQLVLGAVKLNQQQTNMAVTWAGGFHHTKKSEELGFCCVNDIVLAILELLKYHQRVLCIITDIHHSDGAPEDFYATDRVMTIIPKYRDYLAGRGDMRDIGTE